MYISCRTTVTGDSDDFYQGSSSYPMDCMNGRLFIAAFLILIMNDLKVSSRMPTLLPDYNWMYVLEPRPFNLTCITERATAVVWKKGARNPTVIGNGEGFTISNKVETSNGIPTITSTLSKAATRTEDSGIYRCGTVSISSVDIGKSVTIIKGAAENSVYNEINGTATLGCSLSTVDASMYTMHWEFMGKRLTNNTRYTTRNGNIDIEDPVPADGGEYFCVYTLNEGQQVIRMSAFLVVPRTSDADIVDVVHPLYLLPYFLYLLIMLTS